MSSRLILPALSTLALLTNACGTGPADGVNHVSGKDTPSEVLSCVVVNETTHASSTFETDRRSASRQALGTGLDVSFFPSTNDTLKVVIHLSSEPWPTPSVLGGGIVNQGSQFTLFVRLDQELLSLACK